MCASATHSNTAWTFRRPRTSKKHALADPGPSDGLTEAVTAVFSGTSVISGLGKAVVMKTGPATEFGRVAAGLVGRPPETEGERGARRFGFLILEIVIFLCRRSSSPSSSPWSPATWGSSRSSSAGSTAATRCEWRRGEEV